MQTVLKWLVRLFMVTVAGMIVAGALGWYLVSRSLPDYDGEIRLAGLEQPVTIVRDANAVPHISAGTEADGWYALGLAHAQDRLWQMELSRRAAQGRLSALLGARTVDLDRLVKTLNLYGLSSAAVAHQSPETLAALEAYAEGVNAWIRHVNTNALGRGAPEFFAFGSELSPWTPADSISILKMMALRLSAAARNEVRRTQTVLTLPPDRVVDILPEYPVPAQIAPSRPAAVLPGAGRAEGPAPTTPNGASGRPDWLLPAGHRQSDAIDRHAADPLLTAFGPSPWPELSRASNAWAVDGTRTATGKALLANDPHLWLSAPSVWYLAHVETPKLAVIGGTLPGVPAVLVGRTRSLGWGLTTANVDDQDLFIEEVNPDNPDQYRLPDGSWAAFAERSIRIEVTGRMPITEIVRSTRHGPVLTGEQFGANAITPPGHVAALAWTALEPADTTMTAVYEIMTANGINEAVRAAGKVVAPAQNITLAEADAVAMIVAGAIPIRARDSLSQGRVPSAGSHGANDWQGIRPASLNPRSVRPASGAVANANNRTTDAPYPDNVSFDWAYPYRIQRLNKELTARAFHSLDGFMALQTDSVSEMARAVLPLIAQTLWWREGTPKIGDERRRRALEMLAGWNGEMDRHGPEPLIFAEWTRMLTARLAADELGPLFREFEGPRPLFIERVYRDIDGAAIWCDVDKTPETETCAEIASIALDDALANLTREYGSNVEGWRWGTAHIAVHRHTPFGYFGPLGLLFNIENETSGGNYTLLRGQTLGRGDTPFRNVHAAGLRVVYDFADLDASQMIISTGQSGHPFSRLYDHLAEPWARGEMIPMSMREEDARAGALGVMTLVPENAE
ncbi:MAG: penicillin acylase family protein [Pseudomonadota bacterium]